MKKILAIVVLLSIAIIAFFFGEAMAKGTKEHFYPTHAGLKEEALQDYEHATAGKGKEMLWGRDGKKKYGSEQEQQEAIRKAYAYSDDNMKFINEMRYGKQPLAGGITQQAPTGHPAALLALAPPTPDAKSCNEYSEGMRCEWPTQADHWFALADLGPNFKVEADPLGKIVDRWWEKYGVMGPQGLDRLCQNAPICSQLPAPNLPPYALIAKLDDGAPVALAGRHAQPLVSSANARLYVRINQPPEMPDGSYIKGIEGSLPVLIK